MLKALSNEFAWWASPSKIPINTSLLSSGNSIAALSDGDKRVIPFVEHAANKTGL